MWSGVLNFEVMHCRCFRLQHLLIEIVGGFFVHINNNRNSKIMVTVWITKEQMRIRYAILDALKKRKYIASKTCFQVESVLTQGIGDAHFT